MRGRSPGEEEDSSTSTVLDFIKFCNKNFGRVAPNSITIIKMRENQSFVITSLKYVEEEHFLPSGEPPRVY